jgi:xanthine dehydrogenase molybdopterin-binding subunit B
MPRVATNRVRYAGEPVDMVAAADRYRAEDALEPIAVDYRPLPAIVDPRAAAALHLRFRIAIAELPIANAWSYLNLSSSATLSCHDLKAKSRPGEVSLAHKSALAFMISQKAAFSAARSASL